MHDFQNVATTSSRELSGLPDAPRRIPMDIVYDHAREWKGKLCNIDRCGICKQRYEDWVDEMTHEASMRYVD